MSAYTLSSSRNQVCAEAKWAALRAMTLKSVSPETAQFLWWCDSPLFSASTVKALDEAVDYEDIFKILKDEWVEGWQ